MNLMEQAQKDINKMLSPTGEFALKLVFKAPSGEILETTGQFFDRSLIYVSEGTNVSGNHAVVHVSEKPFTDANYPIRRSDGLVTFQNHIIEGHYSDGRTRLFKVADSNVDYSINMITLQLQQYADY